MSAKFEKFLDKLSLFKSCLIKSLKIKNKRITL